MNSTTLNLTDGTAHHTIAASPTLNLPAVQAWLAPRLPGVDQSLQAERMEGGQSNPSWRLSCGQHDWVLRAKPAPAANLLPSAHAIEREFRVLHALQGTAVPVPKVHALCENESVTGVAFYVMDFVHGRIFRDATLPEVSAQHRADCFMSANRVLAQLHTVDWRARGLETFGRQDGYHQRLIQRWSQQYRATCQAPVAAMEQLMDWLPRRIPNGADSTAHTCITHGDYRMENLVFHPTRPEVVAVLDWELSTLGHPLSDLAYNCLAWHMPSGLLRGYADQDLVALGMPSEHEHVTHYCQHTGLDTTQVLADWPFYLALNLFRLSAILQGIGLRHREGTATNRTAADIAAMATPVAMKGWAIAQGLSTPWMASLPPAPAHNPTTPSPVRSPA